MINLNTDEAKPLDVSGAKHSIFRLAVNHDTLLKLSARDDTKIRSPNAIKMQRGDILIIGGDLSNGWGIMRRIVDVELLHDGSGAIIGLTPAFRREPAPPKPDSMAMRLFKFIRRAW